MTIIVGDVQGDEGDLQIALDVDEGGEGDKSQDGMGDEDEVGELRMTVVVIRVDT